MKCKPQPILKTTLIPNLGHDISREMRRSDKDIMALPSGKSKG